MKQKMLGGAALVMTASVNSFAGSCGDKENKDGKVDLSKLEKVDALTGLEVTVNDNVKLKLSELTVKGGTAKFACDKEAFKKDDYNVTLDLGGKETKVNDGEVVCVYKISTDNDGKDLKLEAVSSIDKLDAGSYVIFTSADTKKAIKIEKKVFTKKQKLENKKEYKDDDAK